MENKVYGFYIPSLNLMGRGAIQEVGDRLKGVGAKKTLLVTDEGLKQLGIADEIASIVKKAGLDVVVFPGAEPNPTDKNVKAGLEVYHNEQCDSIVSLGGGSSHDCAKGIGIVASNGGTIHDYEGVDKSEKPLPPLVSINTTAGTASEMTRFCVITDTKRKVKMAIVDKHTTPLISINDPNLMIGMPKGLTAATGMDALTHAVEAYVSTDATPLTDACAIKAIELISQYLRRAVANGQDIEARENMAYAQFLAGMAFNNASLGYVHAIAHQFGGVYNLPHGVCNAILLPHVCRYNLIAKVDRFVDIAWALGENVAGVPNREAAELAIEAIELLAYDVGIPENFTELGVEKVDVELLANHAMKDATMLTNPRKATIEDVKAIIEAAL
ncbi:iron-containing alcohol dehydrogenase [Massilibacterium senegalense]|uniref:iron-containing alcohol dehydrogenase n=1 Tax=Massilibacterium senegalense TaxID=1632858 RepID=UPI0007822392|nr:iron-containing alcohol dehydrogenase [Massilibacterium senegalense]